MALQRQAQAKKRVPRRPAAPGFQSCRSIGRPLAGQDAPNHPTTAGPGRGSGFRDPTCRNQRGSPQATPCRAGERAFGRDQEHQKHGPELGDHPATLQKGRGGRVRRGTRPALHGHEGDAGPQSLRVPACWRATSQHLHPVRIAPQRCSSAAPPAGAGHALVITPEGPHASPAAPRCWPERDTSPRVRIVGLLSGKTSCGRLVRPVRQYQGRWSGRPPSPPAWCESVSQGTGPVVGVTLAPGRQSARTHNASPWGPIP